MGRLAAGAKATVTVMTAAPEEAAKTALGAPTAQKAVWGVGATPEARASAEARVAWAVCPVSPEAVVRVARTALAI